MAEKAYRLRELDFLRGMAILLVLFRHNEIIGFLRTMGWMGVDLFFVLSGFLVAGLLFKEYKKFGSIRPAHFLIRRGFKIYPIYYLALPLYIVAFLFIGGQTNPLGWLSDAFFVQNYTYGWGYLFGASWSLAVEEHFYFGLAVVFWLVTRKPRGSAKKSRIGVETAILSIMILCLALRIVSNIFFPDQTSRNFTMTQFRIDSLLAGVLVAYMYYFKNERLRNIFSKTGKFALPAAFLLLAFTPFVEPIGSFFVMTIGFTMVYTAFALILVYFLMDETINKKLDRIFSRPVVNAVSRIGVYSYSIYVFHMLVSLAIGSLGLDLLTTGLIAFPLSIALGILVSVVIENYFLRLRDRKFPRRIAITS
jgi:peptidoglycan/LPS O-acetylase OafA/YrhL